ncbi:ATP-dependent DNA ligase [Aeromicrobium massiliense]|uniref:ATP-dependent DNA ligase n=1 Tax=Aeromicrobium massiliense TaxID=1464554 RepID=UPI0002FD8973|nr:ATP-dependent DNA ligase [Aeromicrobium massiliense]
MAETKQTVSIAGRHLRLTNPDKVLYPETGTTKADVIAYYVEIAPHLLPHVADRVATRKRWVNGVGTAESPGEVFFEKNLPDSAPDWIRRVTIEHKKRVSEYPVLASEADLAWTAQVAALELHVPQWRVDADGNALNPDRLVVDLDPGPGAGLPECVEVAKHARAILSDVGLDAYPVTSGSKGIHLYAGLDGEHDSDYVREFARQMALALETELPDLVVSSMKKSLRGGKVLVDWSQNNAAKTTIAPYSLRGRARPTVAVPREWDELDDPELRHLTFDEVLERMRGRDDPMAGIYGDAAPPGTDKLDVYRAKRDPDRTPEPVPGQGESMPGSATGELSFVIQEHHASRLHWDFRLEHDGVLVSWALPKGVPTDVKQNHLAVQTEDHPMEYGTFEGSIPSAEYGGGEVTIWDTGTYELEKWRDDEVIAVLTGTKPGGIGGTRRYALIRTGRSGKKDQWLIHLMKDQPSGAGRKASSRASHADAPKGGARKGRRGTPPPTVKPMLATLAKPGDVDDDHEWAFEMKWDGYRIVASVDGDAVRLTSRNGKDYTANYPAVADALAALDLPETVLDGEVVALDEKGVPRFGLLQNAGSGGVDLRYEVFDVLRADGRDVTDEPYAARRELLRELVPDGDVVQVPEAFAGDLEQAVEESKRLGLEGVVAKVADSRYRPGKRSDAWLKLKHQRMQEVVVGGWRPGNGARSGTIGSLLLGIPGDEGLHYAGRVGTGFSEQVLDDLLRRLNRLERKTPPFVDVPRDAARDAHWVTPRLVGEVTFSEWTSDGNLRHPAWRGLRPDKAPEDVRPE